MEDEDRMDKNERDRYKKGEISNSIIRKRNGGVRHQFEDHIGGDSSNYI